MDVAHNHLVDILTPLQVHGIAMQEQFLRPTLYPNNQLQSLRLFLMNNPDIVRPCTTEQPVKHSATDYTSTAGLPIHAYPR